jgi:hypothetical protein
MRRNAQHRILAAGELEVCTSPSTATGTDVSIIYMASRTQERLYDEIRR